MIDQDIASVILEKLKRLHVSTQHSKIQMPYIDVSWMSLSFSSTTNHLKFGFRLSLWWCVIVCQSSSCIIWWKTFYSNWQAIYGIYLYATVKITFRLSDFFEALTSMFINLEMKFKSISFYRDRKTISRPQYISQCNFCLWILCL